MTNVVMPQMGESIAEGTIVRWIKKVGDTIDRDEPLFEISTDKVDAEIPSPAAGVLTEIKVKEGETVPVNSVVATIGVAGEASVPDTPPSGRGRTRTDTDGESTVSDTLPEAAAGEPETTATSGGEGAEPRDEAGSDNRDDVRRQKSSPLVRKIAQEHKVD